MKTIFTPPDNISQRDFSKPSIFLAGTIDMGNSVDWQAETIDMIQRFRPSHYNIFNPRRGDWDSSWEQKFENSHFYQQVNWELNAIEEADWVLLYLKGGSQSPISLLELGILTAEPEKTIVVCEAGFWRKGNVDIVCDRYGIPMFESIKDWVVTL
jgi:hypothetical protein